MSLAPGATLPTVTQSPQAEAFERQLVHLETDLELPGWGYVILLLGLFVIPRILQRRKIPRAITCIVLGAITAGVTTSFGFETQDPAIDLLATLGIVSLFLFAGLEVDTDVIKKNSRVLALHLVGGMLVLALIGWVLSASLNLSPRTGLMVALAIMTPSAGFILESLDSLSSSPKERFWIRTTVISTEILALGVMFVVLQSESYLKLISSAATLIAVILVLPWLFRLFAVWVAPHAPKSEFAFLIVVAISCAFLTKSLGVYYLVGAFVVGMAAQRFRRHLPAMASERMLEAVESFASLFVPFYFFNAGLKLRGSDFGLDALLAGLALVAIATPLRIAFVTGHRKLAVGDKWDSGMRVSVAMLPTLIFTLVLAQILRDQPSFELPSYMFGALIVYAFISTMMPTWVLKEAPPEFDAPHAPAIGYGRDTEESVEEEQEAADVLQAAIDNGEEDDPEAEPDPPTPQAGAAASTEATRPKLD